MLQDPLHGTIDASVTGKIIHINDRISACTLVKDDIDAKQVDAQVFPQLLRNLLCKLLTGRRWRRRGWQKVRHVGLVESLDAVADSAVLDVVRVVVDETASVLGRVVVMVVLQGMQCGGACLHCDVIGDCVSLEERTAVVLDVFLRDDVEVDVVRYGAVHGSARGGDCGGDRGRVCGGVVCWGEDCAQGEDCAVGCVGDGHFVGGVVAAGETTLEDDGEGEGGSEKFVEDVIGVGEIETEPA